MERISLKSCGIPIAEVLPSSCGVAIADSKKSCACPPLSGGCEEVVTVGGRIRTGAGTGVELDQKNEADGASENIGWVGRAAEGKNWRAEPLLNKRIIFG